MLRRLTHCSRRSPAIHASSVASLRFSGSTLRTLQHAIRRSTERYIRFGPYAVVSFATSRPSGTSNSTLMP
jgi:hypothetical protein